MDSQSPSQTRGPLGQCSPWEKEDRDEAKVHCQDCWPHILYSSNFSPKGGGTWVTFPRSPPAFWPSGPGSCCQLQVMWEGRAGDMRDLHCGKMLQVYLGLWRSREKMDGAMRILGTFPWREQRPQFGPAEPCGSLLTEDFLWFWNGGIARLSEAIPSKSSLATLNIVTILGHECAGRWTKWWILCNPISARWHLLLSAAISWTFPHPLYLNSANCSENSATDTKICIALLKKTLPSFGMWKISTLLSSLLKEMDAGQLGSSSCLSWSGGCSLKSNVMGFVSPLTFWLESWEKKQNH